MGPKTLEGIIYKPWKTDISRSRPPCVNHIIAFSLIEKDVLDKVLI